MNILIYTGNHHTRFSYAGWQAHGGVGVVNQTMKMAQVFAAKGHAVTVSGDVATEDADGIAFRHTDDLPEGAHYETVVAVNYAHFMLALDARKIIWDTAILQLHHPDPFVWWQGEEMEGGAEACFRDDRLTWVVALSDAHARQVSSNNPYAGRKLRIIGNALDPADWPARPVETVPGRFVFASSDRGALSTLLDIWPRVREAKPGATLRIAPPWTGDADDAPERVEADGVTWLCSLPPARLHEEIAAAEYWLNPSSHEEEYGLQALEMMRGGVRIVSTAGGHLADLLEERAAIVPEEEAGIAETTMATFLRYDADPVYPAQYTADAKAFAEAQTWDARYEEWMTLIGTRPKPKVLHPELFTYHEDKEAWEKRFLTYAARTKEWELVVDEPFDNCFSLPLFTPEFCRMIREEAEHAESWTTKRHENFPTTDLLLQVIDMNDIYNAVLDDYVVPCAKALWHLRGHDWDTMRRETFLARYTAQAQGHLSLHHDDSDITCLIQLSDLDEYEGGGTYFARQKQVVKSPIGYASIHPGNITHRHGGRAISSGLRYILVSFLKRPQG